MLGFFQSICIATRPKTLVIAVSPVLVGSSLSFKYGSFDGFLFCFILLSAIFIQIGTNFANDVYDFIKGADDDKRLGPMRVVQAGLISIKNMKILTALAFTLSIIFGLPLVIKGGLPILFIGILSIISGYAYTAGPYPLGYNGWGDFFVFCFFGPVAVCGTYFLQNNSLSYASIILGIIIGCLSILLLCINNLRDINTDRKVGKRTLAVRFGPRFIRFLFITLVLLTYLLSFGLTYIMMILNTYLFYLLLFITVPIFIIISKNIFQLSGEALNIVFGQVIFFIILYIGILIASILL